MKKLKQPWYKLLTIFLLLIVIILSIIYFVLSKEPTFKATDPTLLNHNITTIINETVSSSTANDSFTKELLTIENPDVDVSSYAKDFFCDDFTQETTEPTNFTYILPYSNSQYYEETDLIGLTQYELSLARNEIYARHGRIFKDSTLQAYFEAQSWYSGIYSAEEFSSLEKQGIFNSYEKSNLDLIIAYEKNLGYR